VIDSSGTDTLDFSALNQDLTFIIGNTLLTVTDGTNMLNNTGVEIERLIAGSGDDSFKFVGTGVLKGSLDGGAGRNSLDLSAYEKGVNIILSAWGSQNAYAGSSSTVSGGFDNIGVLIGSPGEDTLSGFNADSIWTLDGDNNSYRVVDSDRLINFSQFEKLQGGNLNDIYIIKAGEQAVDIQAGGGHDRLVMEDGSILAGRFDGQGGYDTLDYRNVTGSVVVELSELLGYTDGFDGIISFINNGFANIQAILSGSGSDEFYGRDVEAVFNLLSSGSYYQDVSSQRMLDFAGFESLFGGSEVDIFNISGSYSLDLYGRGGDDLFNFLGAGTINGFIDGGHGNDILDYSGYDSARLIDLTSLGSIDGFNGTENSISHEFRNINQLVGSDYADSLQGLEMSLRESIMKDPIYDATLRNLIYEAQIFQQEYENLLSNQDESMYLRKQLDQLLEYLDGPIEVAAIKDIVESGILHENYEIEFTFKCGVKRTAYGRPRGKQKDK
jgi:hypothetical protein